MKKIVTVLTLVLAALLASPAQGAPGKNWLAMPRAERLATGYGQLVYRVNFTDGGSRLDWCSRRSRLKVACQVTVSGVPRFTWAGPLVSADCVIPVLVGTHRADASAPYVCEGTPQH